MTTPSYIVHSSFVHIIMPVKDSLHTAEQAIRAVVESGYTLTVYDDYSSQETATRLDVLHNELGIEVIHLSERTTHPSPNYRYVLIHAQQQALQQNIPLVIIESDVCIQPDTIKRLTQAIQDNVGMVAAVTTDSNGQINFPYEYARQMHTDAPCTKRLSFCCTLLTPQLLRTYDFNKLNPSKNWYDVHISRTSRQLGFTNILQVTNPVLHTPHSSRPWKQLKYTNPLLYYWRKLTRHLDTI